MVTGYSLSAYGEMVEDTVRMTAYYEAMKRHIRPGSVVVEIGSGPGVMAFLACQLGAARVYAIEPDPSIEVAKRLAVTNGFADRIVFLRKLSTEVELPEQGDVLLSDLRGQLPLHQTHIPSIRDARTRLLKPCGQQLPQRDRLMVGLSRDEESYRAVVRPWEANEYGLDLHEGRRYAINSRSGVNWRQLVSLGEAQSWATIDYRTVESPNVSGKVEFELPAGEMVNGLQLWFEAEVCDGVGYSTGPDRPVQVYSRTWLPLEQPVVGAPGERLALQLAMNFVDGDYVMRWAVDVLPVDGAAPRASFRQSTFAGLIFSPADMRRHEPGFVPMPGGKTGLTRFVLEQFDGKASVAVIATAARAKHPAELKTDGEAVALVRDLARRFCPDL